MSQTASIELTARDQFAMAALTGLLARPLTKTEENLGKRLSSPAERAYELADQMIEARTAVLADRHSPQP